MSIRISRTAALAILLWTAPAELCAQYSFPHPDVDTIETFATDVGRPAGIAMAEDGTILIGDFHNPGFIRKATPDGTISVFATGIRSATGVLVHQSGNIFSTSQDNTVEVVGPEGGEMQTFTGGFFNPSGIVVDRFGRMYVANHDANSVVVVEPDGTVRPFVSGLSGPVGLTTDACGNLYVANRYSNSVSIVDGMGVVDLFEDSITSPHGLAFDDGGNLFVSGAEGITVVTPAHERYLLPGTATNPGPMAFDPAGRLYVSNDVVNTVTRITLKTIGGLIDTIVTVATGFDRPAGLVYQPNGDLLVANFWDPGIISRVAPNGSVSVYASGGGRAVSTIARDSAGYVYGTYQDGTVKRVPPGGGTLATFVPDQANPAGLTFDPAGNLYVVNHQINAVNVYSPAGTFIKSLTAGLSGPVGCNFGPDGYLYVANRYSNSISRFAPDGTPSTFVSGVISPHSLVFDDAGNMFVSVEDQVVMVTPDGVVHPVSDAFNVPVGLAFDADGNLFVASYGGGYVSKVYFAD